MYRKIPAFIEEPTADGLLQTTSNSDEYTDRPLDMKDIDCDFIPYKGDRVRLCLIQDDPPKVYKIEAWDDLRVHKGQITSLTQSYGTVDDDFIFYITDETPLDWDAKINDEVDCVIIEGEYTIGNAKYEYRCEKIAKIVELSDEDRRFEEFLFNDSVDGNVNGAAAAENIDSDTEEEQNVAFDHLKRREPNQEFYDLPAELLFLISEKNVENIKRRLDKFVPGELSYNTYKKRFHALIWLEELEMKYSFDKYKSRAVWIDPERVGRQKRFSIMCSKIAELRPPIAVGK